MEEDINPGHSSRQGKARQRSKARPQRPQRPNPRPAPARRPKVFGGELAPPPLPEPEQPTSLASPFR